MGADVREDLGGLFQLGFVGGFHPFFEFAHDFVELSYDFIPSLAVKFVESLVIIAAEFFGFFSFEVGEISPVPEHQMVGELADGVISFAIGPIGLLGGQAFDGSIGGHEPFGAGVRGTQLREQDFPKSGGFLVLRLKGQKSGSGKKQQKKNRRSLDHLRIPPRA